MNIVTISQNISKIEFALFDGSCGEPVSKGELKNWMNHEIIGGIPGKIATHFSKSLRKQEKTFSANLVCIRVAYGGQEFKSPEIATARSLEKLKKIENAAPMHIPALIELIGAFKNYFRGTPIALVFETSFFTRLPERERNYAINPGLAKEISLQRFGYHGIFHERAYEYCHEKDKRLSRIISVCLEPVPEICAVMGGSPVMVTGGATPLEGLPGETTCGDIDPLIILSLSENLGWGPEEINNAISRKSGIYGLTGRKMDFTELFSSADPDAIFARRLILYRMLLATGSAIAAMGGLDAIVFSGRYREIGGQIHGYLSSKLGKFPEKHEILPDQLLKLTTCSGMLAMLKKDRTHSQKISLDNGYSF